MADDESADARDRKQDSNEIKMIDPNTLHEHLEYDPSTGIIRWRETRSRAVAGAVAGCIEPLGYRRISVDGKRLYAHQVAWLMTFGALPDGVIDHINGDKADNRLANLRAASKSQNRMNSSASQAAHGWRGVTRCNTRGCYIATIIVNGRKIRLGEFDNFHAASRAYSEARIKYFGEFAPKAVEDA